MSLKNLRTCTCHMPQFNDTFLDKSSFKSREVLPDKRDTGTAFHHQPCHSLLCNQTRDVIVRHWIFYLVSEYFHTRCTVLSVVLVLECAPQYSFVYSTDMYCYILDMILTAIDTRGCNRYQNEYMRFLVCWSLVQK